MFFITTKFHDNLLSGFRGVALTNCFNNIFKCGQICKFKRGIIPPQKIESEFPVYMHIYTVQTLNRATTPQKRTEPYTVQEANHTAQEANRTVQEANRTVKKRTVPCKKRTVLCKKRTVHLIKRSQINYANHALKAFRTEPYRAVCPIR